MAIAFIDEIWAAHNRNKTLLNSNEIFDLKQAIGSDEVETVRQPFQSAMVL